MRKLKKIINQNTFNKGLFLFKGLMRDKSRSLLPIIVVSVGVTITVFLQAYLNGVFNDSIETTANFSTGHVKVMTQAYSKNLSQLPNDYAITDVDQVMRTLSANFPELDWAERIQFGGILDVPDSEGKTRIQGNVTGMGITMLSSKTEIIRMELEQKLQLGHFPQKKGDAMLSQALFEKLGLNLNDTVTLISSTMYGDMAMSNFRICGTLHFGTEALDRGMMIAELCDVRTALNMENAAGEILGFFRNSSYNNKKAMALTQQYEALQKTPDDDFSTTMIPLSKLHGMDFLIGYADRMQFILIFVFVLAMSIVLWNAGLVGGLRRYGEFGLRLAIGENKKAIYKTLLLESLFTGIIGSVVGTAIGLFLSYLMQKYGIDTSDMMQNTNMMTPTVFRSEINSTTWVIGFIPGVLSTSIGAALAGIGIFKRQTATLFKELEN